MYTPDYKCSIVSISTEAMYILKKDWDFAHFGEDSNHFNKKNGYNSPFLDYGLMPDIKIFLIAS